MIWKTKNYKGEEVTWYTEDEFRQTINMLHSELEVVRKELEFWQSISKDYTKN